MIFKKLDEMESAANNESQDKALDIEKINNEIKLIQSNVNNLQYENGSREKEGKQNESQIGMSAFYLFFNC